MNDMKKSEFLLYADDNNIHHRLKRIMKSLYYARIQALNNKELASVTSRLAIGENLWETYQNLYISFKHSETKK